MAKCCRIICEFFEFKIHFYTKFVRDRDCKIIHGLCKCICRIIIEFVNFNDSVWKFIYKVWTFTIVFLKLSGSLKFMIVFVNLCGVLKFMYKNRKFIIEFVNLYGVSKFIHIYEVWKCMIVLVLNSYCFWKSYLKFQLKYDARNAFWSIHRSIQGTE